MEDRNRRMLRARDTMDRADVQLALMRPGPPAYVDFTQEPIERFYGTGCGLCDPFGNPIRITEPPEGPVVVPSAEELKAQT
jgi:hypothetical protein